MKSQNTNQAGLDKKQEVKLPPLPPIKEGAKKFLIKPQFSVFFAALALCLIAFFIMPLAATPKKNAISIYAAFPTADLHVTGTFTATGSLNVSGVAVMDVVPNANGMRAHCVLTLTADDGSGTITIHQACQFASAPIKGVWEIVSGTGDYANLKGNGSLLMPGNDEDMTGYIY